MRCVCSWLKEQSSQSSQRKLKRSVGRVCLFFLSVCPAHTTDKEKKDVMFMFSLVLCLTGQCARAPALSKCGCGSLFLSFLALVFSYSLHLHSIIHFHSSPPSPSPSINHPLSHSIHSFATTEIKPCTSPLFFHSSWLAWPFSPSLLLRHNADLVLDHALKETAALLLYGLLFDLPSP